MVACNSLLHLFQEELTDRLTRIKFYREDQMASDIPW